MTGPGPIPDPRKELARRLLSRGQRRAVIPPRDPERPVPLSRSQEQIWLVDKLHGQTSAFNETIAVELRGAVDSGALDQAVARLVGRHDALRTVVVERFGQPLIAETEGAFAVAQHDVATSPDPHAAARELVSELASEPFDLGRGPLLRVGLVRLGGDHHVLVLVTHHLITDGWSVRIVLRDLMAYYAGALGASVELPDLVTTYADYAAWQRNPAREEALEGQLGHWRTRLAGAPDTSELPTDYPRPPVQVHRGARLECALDVTTTSAIDDLARRAGCTRFSVLLTALAAVLGSHSGANEVVIGSTVANRTRRELEEVVGCFVNTIALRLAVDREASVLALLAIHHRVVVDGLVAQEVPFSSVVDALRRPRDLSRNPLFQVMLTLHNQPFAAPVLPGLKVAPFTGRPARTKVDLDVGFVPQASGGLQMVLDFDQALFSMASIQRLQARVERTLITMSARPHVQVRDLFELTGPERDAWVAPWREPLRTAASLSLTDRWADVVRRGPDTIAVSSADGRAVLSYRGLNQLADDLAVRLADQGVQRGDRVGIVCGRDPELAVAVLGVLKAGAAYVPLSTADPRERLAGVVEQAAVTCAVAGSGSAYRAVAEQLPVTVVPAVCGAPRHFGGPSRTPVRVTGGDLAYVLFTSGSTGRPKGVMVAHDHVGRLVDDTARVFSQRAAAWAMVHHYGFDVSVWEFWGCLLSGARLVICDQETARSPGSLVTVLRRQHVGVLCQTPSALSLLLDHDRRDTVTAEALSLIVVAGERFDFRSLTDWVHGHGIDSPRFVNMLGPTETTVYATYRGITEEDLKTARSFVGGPLSSSRLLAVDDTDRPVPDGVAGELLIGGSGVTWGYLGQPARTAERFVPDPTGTAARVYRTGDLVRPEPGPDFEYLGRLDGQVKLRGYRIELGEIETALQQYPDVSAAAAAKVGGPGRDERLAAWVTLRGGGQLDETDLRSFLSRRLPSYMLPADVSVLDALPTTSSGKLDRSALVPRAARQEGRARASAVRWRSELEQRLAAHWRVLLDVAEVRPDDNLFELGAHSLLAVRFQNALAEDGLTLELHELFAAPTVRGQAAVIEQRQASTALRTATPDNDPEAVLRSEERGGTRGELRRAVRVRQLSADEMRRK